MQHSFENLTHKLNGWLGADVYSTAWVALVPDISAADRPAWPQALDYLRLQQLEDGGWGNPHVYYAHERTISTMAAIKALHAWRSSADDDVRIIRGLRALRRYSSHLTNEAHEPIGFEMLLPRLRGDLLPFFADELPLDNWAFIDTLYGEKLALIPHLKPDSTQPQTWWFSMEMLADEQLARLDDSLLDARGSIATSPAATAAYLAARRHAGEDSPLAAGYLTRTLDQGGDSVPFCWPAEVFDRVWALDNFRRAGMEPTTPFVAGLVESVHMSWNLDKPGLSFSDMFPTNDGDDTAVGFTVLNWAGLRPSDEPLLAFWQEDHFLTYLDERSPSVSANLHALTALRSQPDFPHEGLARQLSEWLVKQMRPDVIFEDKWHLSPYYPVARAIPAFAGWDDSIARRCVRFLVKHQQPDGGWGWFGRSTLEETAHCVIGLCFAFHRGLIDSLPLLMLQRAAKFIREDDLQEPMESLWIGKTVYRPEGVVSATLLAAKAALEKLGLVTSLQATSAILPETRLAALDRFGNLTDELSGD